ncbi:MAG: hypothetical protein ACM3U2_09580 [Deltaproteobacteria bacterium]
MLEIDDHVKPQRKARGLQTPPFGPLQEPRRILPRMTLICADGQFHLVRTYPRGSAKSAVPLFLLEAHPRDLPFAPRATCSRDFFCVMFLSVIFLSVPFFQRGGSTHPARGPGTKIRYPQIAQISAGFVSGALNL